jgi:hypothetical protein
MWDGEDRKGGGGGGVKKTGNKTFRRKVPPHAGVPSVAFFLHEEDETKASVPLFHALLPAS